MSDILSNKYVLLVSRCVLGTVFIVAAIDKISNPDIFAEAVQAYQLLPFSLVNIFALVVPWVELLCGIFLVVGVFLRSSSMLLSFLLLAFIVAMLSALVRHLQIDCGCFGAAHASTVGWDRILEDIGLYVLGVHVFMLSKLNASVK